MLPRRNVEFDHPFDGQIATVGGGIFGDVARDIGELKRDAEVRRAVERRFVARVHAHYKRHRDADRTGDMIGVAQQVVLAARAPVLRIEFETRDDVVDDRARDRDFRSEEHTSELQSLMRISYAVFCLKKKKTTT